MDNTDYVFQTGTGPDQVCSSLQQDRPLWFCLIFSAQGSDCGYCLV